MEGSTSLSEPVFTKVDKLRPGTSGHTLTIKVVQQMSTNEFLVGDDSGTILFTARNEQVNLMQEDATLILHNAKIVLVEESMRLAVDEFGRIEVAKPADFTVDKDFDISKIKFEERVDVKAFSSEGPIISFQL